MLVAGDGYHSTFGESRGYRYGLGVIVITGVLAPGLRRAARRVKAVISFG